MARRNRVGDFGDYGNYSAMPELPRAPLRSHVKAKPAAAEPSTQ
jgi:hypothetical protein